jgi:RNA polymerase sigma factor for flagellar operon FliA
MIEGSSMYVATETQPAHEAPQGELHSLLTSMSGLVEELSEPGRTIIRRHYFDGMQFSAIAELVGLSKGRVSQLHARALADLRKRYRRKGALNLEI